MRVIIVVIRKLTGRAVRGGRQGGREGGREEDNFNSFYSKLLVPVTYIIHTSGWFLCVVFENSSADTDSAKLVHLGQHGLKEFTTNLQSVQTVQRCGGGGRNVTSMMHHKALEATIVSAQNSKLKLNSEHLCQPHNSVL